MIPKAKATKAKITIVRPYQTKKQKKGKNQQCEKTTYRMGKIFANHISDKGLICKIHKKLLQFNSNNK